MGRQFGLWLLIGTRERGNVLHIQTIFCAAFSLFFSICFASNCRLFTLFFQYFLPQIAAFSLFFSTCFASNCRLFTLLQYVLPQIATVFTLLQYILPQIATFLLCFNTFFSQIVTFLLCFNKFCLNFLHFLVALQKHSKLPRCRTVWVGWKYQGSLDDPGLKKWKGRNENVIHNSHLWKDTQE